MQWAPVQICGQPPGVHAKAPPPPPPGTDGIGGTDGSGAGDEPDGTGAPESEAWGRGVGWGVGATVVAAVVAGVDAGGAAAVAEGAALGSGLASAWSFLSLSHPTRESMTGSVRRSAERARREEHVCIGQSYARMKLARK